MAFHFSLARGRSNKLLVLGSVKEGLWPQVNNLFACNSILRFILLCPPRSQVHVIISLGGVTLQAYSY